MRGWVVILRYAMAVSFSPLVPQRTIANVVVDVAVVVFTSNRFFYPTTSAVPPVSVLILHLA